MGKTFKEQFVEALENGITHKAIFLAQFMKDEINEPYDYRSPLVWAKRYGNEKVVQALSDMGAVEVVDKEGMSDELLKILWRKDIDNETEKRAIELIKDGANIEKKGKFGYTALIMASSHGHVKVVKALLDAGADVTITDDDGDTALMYTGCTEIVKLLLDNGAKVDEKNNYGETALIKASRNGNVEVVKTLISMGAKVDEKDNDGETALIWVSRNGHVEVVEALLSMGAKINEKSNHGDTALIKASWYGRLEVVKTLISRGAKVDEKDNNGKTALIWASLRGNVEVVKALLEGGADVTITNNDGKTAIDYTGNDEIKKLLNEAMERKKERAKKTTQETSENDVWSKIGKLFGRE